MNENSKPLSVWIREQGYRWTEGNEAMAKGLITWMEAQQYIEEYIARGWLVRG